MAIAAYVWSIIPNIQYYKWVKQNPLSLLPNLHLLELTPTQRAEYDLCRDRIEKWDKLADWTGLWSLISVFFMLIALILFVC
jgi:hypothetical protein